jgi:purine nucleoside permease
MALPGLRRQLPVMMGLAWMAGLVAWGVGRGYLDLGGDSAAVSARLLAVFGPLFSAGIFYWAVSGLAGVDSAKAILGIFRRKRPE